MTWEALLLLKAKLENAVSFGVQAQGNLEWAKAQLIAVNIKLEAMR